MDGMNRPRALIVGEVDHPEFAEVCAWLADHSHLLGVADSRPADLVAVFQSRPGSICQSEIEALHRRLPLAGFVVVLGSWCEGETRSGRPLHGMERVFWYEAVGRLGAVLSKQGVQRSPRTESHAEAIIRETHGSKRFGAGKPAVVVAANRQAYEPLRDMCESLGYAVDWFRPGTELPAFTPALIVWDANDVNLQLLGELAAMREICPLAPIAMLLNFPRRHEVGELLRLGCRIVLGKPFSVLELAARLDPTTVESQSHDAAA